MEYSDDSGHVNFTGRFKCKEAGGELDEVFADMGIGRLLNISEIHFIVIAMYIYMYY